MKKSFLLLALLLLFVMGCIPPSSCPQYGITYQNALQFIIYEQETKRDVVLVYNTDSLAVYDENWNKLEAIPEWTIYNGRWVIAKDKATHGQRVTRNFYVYFNHMDTDTITTVFELQQGTGECPSDNLSYVKVSYNDSVYYDMTYGTFEWLRFYKE